MKQIKLAYMNPEQVANEIGDFLIDRIQNVNATGGVLGLSGGVDSTCVAALTKKAFDRYNTINSKKLELVGYILPSAVNSPLDAEDGTKVAKRLGIRYEAHDIEPVVTAYKHTNPEAFIKKFDKGNLMSRIRANILSTKAATEKKVVIGTGNKDEDFGIGYYTLFGDGAVHLSPIGNLPKRLVRQMAGYLGFPDLANRVPTAGLELGQTDFTDLGYNYDAVELIIEAVNQKFSLEEIVKNKQIIGTIQPQLAEFKKFNAIEQVIEDVLRRHRFALGKMKIIHPPIAPITLEYR